MKAWTLAVFLIAAVLAEKGEWEACQPVSVSLGEIITGFTFSQLIFNERPIKVLSLRLVCEILI